MYLSQSQSISIPDAEQHQAVSMPEQMSRQLELGRSARAWERVHAWTDLGQEGCLRQPLASLQRRSQPFRRHQYCTGSNGQQHLPCAYAFRAYASGMQDSTTPWSCTVYCKTPRSGIDLCRGKGNLARSNRRQLLKDSKPRQDVTLSQHLHISGLQLCRSTC